MNRFATHKIQKYTLIEILVAMAILVIMMGFLFQFVISGHKMWAASENTSNVFDQAQIVLQLIENDLQSVIFAGDETNPGRSIPMLLERDTDPDKTFKKIIMFIPDSNISSDVGAFMVIYKFENENLIRIVLDEEVDIAGETVSQYGFFGCDPVKFFEDSNANEKFVADALIIIIDELEKGAKNNEIIAQGVSQFSMQYLPDNCSENISGFEFFKEVPNAFKITFESYDYAATKKLLNTGLTDGDAPVKNKKLETSRSFTKVVFLR